MKTVLAIVAILSLLLSAVAIARPVIAHEGGDHVDLANGKDNGIPADDPDFEQDCTVEEGVDPGEALFHFILNGLDDGTTLDQFEASFDTDGDGVADVTYTDSDPNVEVTQNASDNFSINVIVDDDAVLIDATAHISAQDGVNPEPKLVLSHTCVTADVDGSLTILKTDDLEPATPLSATFQVTGPEGYDETFSTDATTGMVCIDGLVPGEYTITETVPPAGYDPADPASQTFDVVVDDGCASDDAAVDVTFENTLTELGSITVVKEVGCEDCETRTIGYYFNTADQHDEETNALFDELGGIMADGILFTNVDQVQQYRADDMDGTSDGQNGLSARGQLTLQYLAAQLNVARNGADCDLASRVYHNADSPFDGWTVQQILDEADAAFAGTSIYSDQDIQSALDDINNSSHEEENPLSCEGSENGTLDGVTFDLFLEADYPDGDPIDSQTTANGGMAVFADLELDMTYVLVESGFPEGMTCEIVDVIGEGVVFTLNDDGSVTIDLTANNPDITVTVVNDCEEGQQEEQFGEIEVRKVATDDDTESFSFSATWDGDGFILMDGGAEFSGDLALGEFTVTESLSADQVTAGWSLADIDCGDAAAVVSGDGMSVTITLGADEHVICTFTNELGEGGEAPGGGGGGEGTLGGNPPVPNTAMDFGATDSVPAALLALLMLSGLSVAGYAARAEARRRR
jgi:hypothetical protein